MKVKGPCQRCHLINLAQVQSQCEAKRGSEWRGVTAISAPCPKHSVITLRPGAAGFSICRSPLGFFLLPMQEKKKKKKNLYAP